MNKKKIIIMLTFLLFVNVVSSVGYNIISPYAFYQQPIKFLSIDNADFVINETSHFDAGNKTNTTTITERYNQTANTLEIDFPYAEKDANLTAYWSMSNTLVDETGTQNLVNQGADGFASGGIFNLGYYNFIRGNTDYMTAVDGGNFPVGSQMSISFWINRDDTTLSAYMSKDVGTAGSSIFLIRADHDSMTGQISSDGDKIGDEDQAVVLGTGSWKHIVMVMDISGNRWEMYVDGSSIRQETLGAGSFSDNNGLVNLGRDNRAVSFYDGQMSQIKWYQRALSDTEVEEIYNDGLQYINTTGSSVADWTSDTINMTAVSKLSNMTIKFTANGFSNISKIEWLKNSDGSVLATYNKSINSGLSGTGSLLEDDSLVSYYRFENNADDFTGLNDGTNNGADYTSSGKFGGAYDFVSANSDYIDLGNSTGKPIEYTISAWIKPDVIQSNGIVFSTAPAGANEDAWGIYASATNIFYVYVSNGTNDQQLIMAGEYTSGNYSSTEYTFITATVNGNNITYYRNGNLINSTPQTVQMGGIAYNMSIGRYGEYDGLYFDGTIDDVAIFNRSLTADEISALYNSSKFKFINDSSLTSGSFDSIDDDFKVRITLGGNGFSTPKIYEIFGEYELIIIPKSVGISNEEGKIACDKPSGISGTCEDGITDIK